MANQKRPCSNISEGPHSYFGRGYRGHTLVCEFQADSIAWKVYEDLRIRDGALTFVCSTGARVLAKSAEASFAETATPYLGLSLTDIGTSGPDLLASRLLQSGDDPDPELVRSAAPPLGSLENKGPSWRLPWDTLVGTKECSDTMPVFSNGSTRTYHPVQHFPQDNQKTRPEMLRWLGRRMDARRPQDHACFGFGL